LSRINKNSYRLCGSIKQSRIAGFFGVFGLCAANDRAVAQGVPEAGAMGAAAQSLRLGGHSVGGFLEARAARLEALAAAQNSQGLTGNAEDAVSRALLDVATFYLAHGFIPEGRDITEALAGATMSPRWRRIATF
jgi:hypothetical protein